MRRPRAFISPCTSLPNIAPLHPSAEKAPPIDAVLGAGVVPAFVELLQAETTPRLQFEACWALTNIASGTSMHTAAVIQANAVPSFVRLLESPMDDVREQAIWALGNIAGDSVRTRDLVIEHGIIPPLLRCVTPLAKESFIRNASWTISNLCRGKPLPPLDVVNALFPKLAALITSEDREALADALWALSYLSDGDESRLQAFLESGALERVVKLLDHPKLEVVTPALRTIGNVVTGDDLQTQAAINEGALLPVARLLTHSRKGVRKEACWLISNVCAGTIPQIQAVIEANIIPMLINLMTRGEPEVSREACWALSNATTGGSSDQIALLVHYGIIPPFTQMLTRVDPKVQVIAIEGLENILRHLPPASMQSPPSYKVFMEEAGVPAALEGLISAEHTQQAPFDKAQSFLQAHFPNYSEYAEGEEEEYLDDNGPAGVYGALVDSAHDGRFGLPQAAPTGNAVSGQVFGAPINFGAPQGFGSAGFGAAPPFGAATGSAVFGAPTGFGAAGSSGQGLGAVPGGFGGQQQQQQSQANAWAALGAGLGGSAAPNFQGMRFT